MTRRFYKSWNEDVYRELMDKFALDDRKTVSELSSGMRVKYSIALALSHEPKLLILDEPTSGLDPVSRDEVLELMQEIVESGQRSILFSTHIISDIEKIADYVTYIKNGRILFSVDTEELREKYLLISGENERLTPELEGMLTGLRRNKFGFSGLIERKLAPEGFSREVPSFEDIMIYIERGVQGEKSDV